MDANQTYWEKAKWELHKNAICYFERILEAAPHKTAAVQPLTSCLANHSSKTKKHAGSCWRSKDKYISNILLRTPTHGHTGLGQAARIYLYQLCVESGWSLESLLGALNDRNEWRGRVWGICAVSATWWWSLA